MMTSQFSAEHSIGSGAICYLTDGDYSHVDLVVPHDVILAYAKYAPAKYQSTLLGWVPAYGFLGARLGGVLVRPPTYAKFSRIAWCSCQVPNEDAGYKFAFSQIGKPYDKKAILDFFLHRARKFSPDMPEWFCDCLNYTVFMEAGKLLLNTTDPERLTPQEEYLSGAWIEKRMLK